MKNDVCFGDFLHRSNFLRVNAMLSLFITSTSTVEKEKSPLLFAGRIINGDLPALPPLKKYPEKFNAIFAHELFDLKVTVEVKWGFLISFKLTLII